MNFNSFIFIIAMTQRQLQILTLLSIALFILNILQLSTIVTFTLATCLLYKLFKMMLARHLQRGLIDHLPQSLQNNLLNKSILDLISEIWYYEIFKFVKIMLKPLIYPADSESSLEVLQEFKQTGNNKYLTKGIIRIMPKNWQKILLGHERLSSLRDIEEEEATYYNMYEKEYISDRNTDDQSEKEHLKVKSIFSSLKEIPFCEMEEQIKEDLMQKQLKMQKIKQYKEQKLQLNKKKSLGKKGAKNIIQIVQDSVGMIKKLIELQNVPGKILKIDTLTIIKLMIVFWIILFVQLKFNKNGRQVVLKIIHVLGGIISVFGVVGTTGMLIYKNYSKCQKKALKEHGQA